MKQKQDGLLINGTKDRPAAEASHIWHKQRTADVIKKRIRMHDIKALNHGLRMAKQGGLTTTARFRAQFAGAVALIAMGTHTALSKETNPPAPEPEWAHKEPEAPTIPYFSAKGQAYAKIHHLPQPPFFRHNETKAVDPPRDVPAVGWNGRFCKEWTDECTICKRGADQRPQCKPVVSKDPCTRHAVTCTTTGSYPDDLMYKYCRNFESHRIERLHGVETDVTTDWAGISWYLARRDRRWHFYLGEDAYLPAAPRPGQPRPPKPEYAAEDERCTEAIGAPPPKNDNDRDPVIER